MVTVDDEAEDIDGQPARQQLKTRRMLLYTSVTADY
jgi:hypothetical protein